MEGTTTNPKAIDNRAVRAIAAIIRAWDDTYLASGAGDDWGLDQAEEDALQGDTSARRLLTESLLDMSDWAADSPEEAQRIQAAVKAVRPVLFGR